MVKRRGYRIELGEIERALYCIRRCAKRRSSRCRSGRRREDRRVPLVPGRRGTVDHRAEDVLRVATAGLHEPRSVRRSSSAAEDVDRQGGLPDPAPGMTTELVESAADSRRAAAGPSAWRRRRPVARPKRPASASGSWRPCRRAGSSDRCSSTTSSSRARRSCQPDRAWHVAGFAVHYFLPLRATGCRSSCALSLAAIAVISRRWPAAWLIGIGLVPDRHLPSARAVRRARRPAGRVGAVLLVMRGGWVARALVRRRSGRSSARCSCSG